MRDNARKSVEGRGVEQESIEKRGRFWIRQCATLFGTGYAPKAPGTFGTLWGVPVAIAISRLEPNLQLLTTLLFAGFAVFICEQFERKIARGRHDLPEVVIDEVAGYLVAFIWLPPESLWSYLFAFVAFRFFDIFKPGPIRVIDRKVKGGFGVVADDLAAGVAASLCLQALLQHWNWSQWG